MKQIKKSKIFFLIGMPGSGKSTLGKLLSNHFKFPYLDMDEEIEAKEKMSISNIFKNRGEDYFRTIEKDILINIDIEPSIIATGGGVPCFYDNMNYINTIGVSIWLQVPLETLAKRVLIKEGSRPLLKNLKGEALLNELKKKYDVRKPFYELAHIHHNQDIQSNQELITSMNQTLKSIQ